MSGLKKFLPGKKKSKKSSAASLQSATSEQNIPDGNSEPGYRNVKEKDLPKLHKAVWNGDFAKVKQLTKKGDVNQMDKHHRTPLHYACVRGSNDIVEWLCGNRAKLGICDAEGRTALMKAVECAKQNCVQTLLAHGAETNVVDVSLVTPLHLTATHGSTVIGAMLLERDARVNAADTEKLTPLHVAATLGFPEFVEFLLKEFALVDEVDVYGRTPLIASSMEGHIAIVKQLLDAGADTEVKDNEGWKAADHAAMSGYHSISNLIEESTNDQNQPQSPHQNAGSNFGSGTGTPFKSSSTQPVSSIFGGPAINVNVDTDDESTEHDSPSRHDFHDSWADSDIGDAEEERVTSPNLAKLIDRKESTNSPKASTSRIPVVSSSKENLSNANKAGSSSSLHDVTASASNLSRIPKLETTTTTAKATSPKGSASNIPLPVAGQSKIPMPKGKSPSPEKQILGKTSAAESKIPRFSNSPSPTKKDLTTGKVVAAVESKSKTSVEKKEPNFAGPADFSNSELSGWDSDSGDFSELDPLDASIGSSTKKKEDTAKPAKLNLKDRFSLFQASKAAKGSPSAELQIKSPPPQSQLGSKDEVASEVKQPHQNETGQANEHQNKAERNEKFDNEFDSSTDEVSTPRPVLEMKAKGKVLGVKDGGGKDDFDLNVASPAMANNDIQDAELLAEDGKLSFEPPLSKEKDDESEFSDFSLQESMDPTQGKHLNQEKQEGKSKEKQDRKAKLAALGLDLGSSVSSVSEIDDVGEFDTSLTNHDALFSPPKTTPKANMNEINAESNNGSSVQGENGLKDTIDSGLGRTAETREDAIDAQAKAAKSSSKAQFDALGIEFSDEEDSSFVVSESESEWEKSLRKKKEEQLRREDVKKMMSNEIQEKNVENEEDKTRKIATEELFEDTATETESEDEIIVNEDPKKKNMQADREEAVEEEDVAEKKKMEDLEKRDSEFISDEDFSLHTEDQLEELESARLKGDDGIDDFDEGSDFSYFESKKDDEGVEHGDESSASDSESEVDESASEIELRADGNKIRLDASNVEEEVVVPAFQMKSETTPDRKESDRKTKQTDEERMRILRNMAGSNTVMNGNAEKKMSAEKKKSNEDDDRRQKLEAMVQPVAIQQVNDDFVESLPERMEEKLLNGEDPVSAAVEEEFERKLREKEEESRLEAQRKEDLALEKEKKRVEEDLARKREESERKRREEEDLLRIMEEEVERKRREEDDRRSKKEESKRRREEAERKAKEEEFEAQLRLKEEEMQREQEAASKRTVDLEKQRIQQETDAQMKRFEEELKKREREFEEQMRNRELEEKEMRERRIVNGEKELEDIKLKQIKGMEEEYFKMQQEKLDWQKKREEQAEKILKEKEELAELSKKRREQEQKAIEASIRLKEQELLWQQKQTEMRNDPDTDLRTREREELARIDGLLKESSRKEEGRKKKESSILEDLVSQQSVPIDQAGLSLEGEAKTFTNPMPTKLEDETEKRLNQSKQMREEAEQLLQAARDKTNAMMTGKRQKPPPLPFSTSQYAAEADYGNEIIDQDFSAGPNGVQDLAYSNFDKPRSDMVNVNMNNEHEAILPATSSPYEPSKRSLDSKFAGQEEPSPIKRPQTALGIADDPTYTTATPLALYASLSKTGHFKDSKALMKMQDSLREAKRELDRTKSRNTALETSKREMEVDIREMQRAVDLLSKSQTDFERFRVDAEMELRETKYRLEQELEAKASLEGTNVQLKEQLKKAENKLISEGEARQTIELAYKTMEAEFKIRENVINQLENDVNDLRFALSHEREARVNQEKMYTEQLEQHEALLEEAQHTSFQHAQTVGQLEALDQNRKSAEAAVDGIKVEFAKAKGELVRVTAQLDETKSTYENEVSRLRRKLQEQSDALVKAERESFQVQMQMEAEKSNAKADHVRLASSLDNEVANRKRVETETQLHNANTELERLTKTKSLTESETSKFKEETFRDKSKQEKELAAVKDELQRTIMKLENTERRCDAIDAELQSANIALANQSGQVAMASREVDYKNGVLKQLEDKVRSEKETSQRLTTKIETQNERTAMLQREIDNLRRELDSANQRSAAYDKSARDSEEKFKTLLANTRDELDKERVSTEALLERANEASLHYQSQLSEAKDEIKKKDFDLRQVEKELSELSRKLSAAEASNEVQLKSREQLEDIKSHLSQECAVLEKNVSDLQAQRNELLVKVDDLTEQLEHTLKVSDHTNNRLAQKSADVQVAKKTRDELEKAVTRLKVDKAELESELREERTQSEMILDDLRKSNEVLVLCKRRFADHTRNYNCNPHVLMNTLLVTLWCHELRPQGDP
eukprot:gene6173-6884_t